MGSAQPRSNRKSIISNDNTTILPKASERCWQSFPSSELCLNGVITEHQESSAMERCGSVFLILTVMCVSSWSLQTSEVCVYIFSPSLVYGKLRCFIFFFLFQQNMWRRGRGGGGCNCLLSLRRLHGLPIFRLF